MPKANKENAIYRQWAILKILSSQRRLETQQIHQLLLEQHEIAVHENTVLRDLKNLEKIGFPLNRSDTKPIDWWLKKEWQEKIAGMTEGEALLAMLVKEYLKEILPINTLKQLDDLFELAEKKLNSQQNNHASQWLAKIRVIAAQQPQLPPVVRDSVKAVISDALMHNQVIKAQYKSHIFLLSPLALLMRGQVIYLAAVECDDVTQVKHFALHRFDSASIAYGEKFNSPENFNIDELLKAGWGHFQQADQEKNIRLVFWCDRYLKDHLAEMRLAANQWIDFTNPQDDHYMVTVKLPYTWQLKQWLLSQGSKVRVVKPIWLREALQEEIQAMLNNYKS